MIRRLLMVPLAALTLTTTGSGAFAADELPPLPMPAVSMPAPTHLTVPPGENTYFPLGEHGQAYYLNMDGTVNWTDIINKTYVNPYWRDEDWTPYATYWLAEHQSRLMGTWQEYDQETLFRKGTHFAQWLEKWSGFGP